MKMRKKLAALLAAAMIASVMPMTAFAASTNRVTNSVTGKTEDTITTNAPTVKIELKDDLVTGVAFYLNLAGAEWSAETALQTAAKVTGPASGTSLKITRVGSKVLRVEADGATIEAKQIIEIPLLTTLKGGEATVEVESAGTVVDNSKHVFANASDDAATKVVVGSASSFADVSGGVATITLKEPFKGAYKGKSVEDRTFTIELRDSDFFFDPVTYVAPTATDGAKGTRLVGTKGFYNRDVKGYLTSVPTGEVELGAVVVKADEITVIIPKTDEAQAGEFELVGVKVRAKKGATKGEIAAVVRGHLIDGAQEIVVAKYADFTTKLAMKKEYEVETGKSVDVEFTLSEEIADSLLTNRSLDFTLSNGAKFDATKAIKVTPKDTNNTSSDAVTAVIDTDNYESFELGNLKLKSGEKAQYKMEATILVPNNFKGDEITLTAEGRALSEKHEVVAAKVNKAISVEVTPIDVKVGLQKQVGGKIVIKENVKEAVLRNYKNATGASRNDAEIVIAIDDNYDNLRITDADIEVTEGDLILDLDKKVVSGGQIRIPVKRQSTKPSTIEITNIEVTANRSVPEGTYDIKVGGYALSEHSHATEFTSDKAFKDDVTKTNVTGSADYFFDSVTVEKLINITTKNTEDIKAASAATVNFVVGSDKYLVNGVEETMDVAAYVKDGRTMVPVRFVAAALGVKAEQVVWDGANQTATILADKTIQVKLGSKMMVVDGVSIPMTAAAELTSDRTFIPVSEIARALNVPVEWNEDTKTATFN